MRGRQPGLVALLILVAVPLVIAISADALATEPIFVTARMPDYKVTHEDAYLCTAVSLPDQALKLVGVEPLAKQEIAHHMLLFGCETPASKKPVWDCHMRSPCGAGPENTISHGEHVLYGWGKDAPAMHLPPGAGFSVGPRTGIRTAILQVHYQIVRPEGDHTGVRLELTPEPQPFSAGMFTYASGFVVPPRQPAFHVPATCCYAGWEPIKAFAFRVHAHSLGRQIWMDREPMGPRPQERIVGQDPQLPQGFYPVTEGVRFLPGDQLKVTCEFDSTSRDRPTNAGSTSKDEMCNMYMMTYSELPVFMTCGNGQSWYQVDGPGGIPPGSTLAPESPAVWQPPLSAGASMPAGDELTLGQIAGVAHSLDGETLWVVHRGPRVWDGRTYAPPDGERLSEATLKEGPIAVPTVVQLQKETGRVMRAWGQGALYLPHSVVTDRDGNVWVTDTGLHQVLKFSEDGRQLLALGEALTPGQDASHFCKPTAVAFSRSGDFFVADGYCNSRVLRFSPDGAMIQAYTLPKKVMNIPHSLVIDDCANALYVADRENAAVQRFTMEGGQHERTIDLRRWGPVYAITMGPYGTLLALCWQRGGGETLVSVVHVNPYDDNRVINEWPLEGVIAPHDLTISSAPLRITGSGERMLAVYVAETRPAGSRLHKFILLHRGLSVTSPDAAASAANSSAVGEGNSQPKSDTSPDGTAADGGGMHVSMDQDLLQPPQYEVEDAMSFQDAVWRMFMLGGPFAMAFAAVALVLWRRMSALGPQFQPVSSHEV